MIRRCLVALVFVPAFTVRADTVYLKNGEWIDGKVSIKTNAFVELQIGDIGKIELPVEEIHSIERNSRTGGRAAETYVEPKGKAEVLRGKGSEAGKSAAGDKKDSKDASKTEGEGAKLSKVPTKTDPSLADEPKDVAADDDADSAPKEVPIDPDLKARILELVANLERQRSRERVQAERHLEAIGPPSIPYLLPLSKSENDLTRTAVMRLFHSFGDDRVIEPAIAGLLDDNEYVRDYAGKALKRITGEDFGFQAGASPRRREASHRKWTSWWEAEKKSLEETRKLSERAQ